MLKVISEDPENRRESIEVRSLHYSLQVILWFKCDPPMALALTMALRILEYFHFRWQNITLSK